MPPKTKFRPMAPVDLPGARRLWSAAEGVELAEGDSPGELRRYLRRNPGLSHVALVGSRLAGAVLAGHDGRRGYIYHLAVSRRHRGQGLGRALAARSLVALKRTGVIRTLILVSRDNATGRKFWRREGWELLRFAQVMGRDL